MSTSLEDLTVIIVTRNSHRVLSALLGELDECLLQHLLIVDNASNDNTRTMAGDFGTTLICNSRNHGFAVAANQGARAAESQFLCFLNPDCRTTTALFQEGIEAIRAEEKVVASPGLDEGEFGVTHGRQEGYSAIRLVFDTLFSNYGTPRLMRWWRSANRWNDPSWQWAHGACFFVRKEFFLDLGGFDERFFLYMEDVDLGKRTCQKGGRIVELQQLIRHRSAQSSRLKNSTHLAHLNRGRAVYARKHFGPFIARCIAAMGVPGVLVRRMVGR